jgi:hypothetical protein
LALRLFTAMDTTQRELRAGVRVTRTGVHWMAQSARSGAAT